PVRPTNNLSWQENHWHRDCRERICAVQNRWWSNTLGQNVRAAKVWRLPLWYTQKYKDHKFQVCPCPSIPFLHSLSHAPFGLPDRQTRMKNKPPSGYGPTFSGVYPWR